MAKPKSDRQKSFILTLTYEQRSLLYRGVARRMLQTLNYHQTSLSSLSSLVIEMIDKVIGNPPPPKLNITNNYLFFTQLLPGTHDALHADSKAKKIALTKNLLEIVMRKELSHLQFQRSADVDKDAKRTPTSYNMPVPFKATLVRELARRLQAGNLPISKKSMPSINDIVEEALADEFNVPLPVLEEPISYEPHERINISLKINEDSHTRFKEICAARGETMTNMIVKIAQNWAFEEGW